MAAVLAFKYWPVAPPLVTRPALLADHTLEAAAWPGSLVISSRSVPSVRAVTGEPSDWTAPASGRGMALAMELARTVALSLSAKTFS